MFLFCLHICAIVLNTHIQTISILGILLLFPSSYSFFLSPSSVIFSYSYSFSIIFFSYALNIPINFLNAFISSISISIITSHYLDFFLSFLLSHPFSSYHLLHFIPYYTVNVVSAAVVKVDLPFRPDSYAAFVVLKR